MKLTSTNSSIGLIYALKIIFNRSCCLSRRFFVISKINETFLRDELVHQIISKPKLEKLTKNNKKYIINLTKDDYINLVNICVGFYSPLKGFCDYRDYCSIIEKNKRKLNLSPPPLVVVQQM